MAQYDGSIRIDTRLNTKNFQKDSKKLLSGMEKLGSSLNGIIKTLGVGLSLAGLAALGKQAVETASDIQEVQNVVDTAFGSMSYKMEQFASTAVKQFGISQLSAKQLGSTFMAMGASMVRDMEKASDMAINLTARSADMASFYNSSLQEVSTAAKSIYTGETESLKQYGVVMTEVNLQEYAATQGITKKISAMTQAEKVQLRYNYFMEQTALAAGDFAKTSDSWANQTRILSEQFKELLSVLGSGLIAVLTPAIKLLNTMLSQLILIAKQIGSVLSELFGISIPTASTGQMAKDLTEAADGAGELAEGIEEARKAAKGALAPFDKLNVLSQDKGGASSSGGGTAGAGGIVPVPEIDTGKSVESVGVLDTALEELKGRLIEIKNILAGGFFDGLGDFQPRIDSIKESLGSIKESIIEIWTDPEVLGSANGWTNSVIYMLGSLAGSMASIGVTIATNLIGGISRYLEENKDTIKEYMVSMFNIGEEINGLIAEFSKAFAYVFEAFADENGQQLTANLIGMFTDAFMGLSEIVGKLARDVLNIILKPFIENKEEFRETLDGWLGILSEVLGTLKDSIDETLSNFNKMYDKHLKPFFDSIEEGLSDTVGKFLEFWNDNVKPILESWAKKFDEIWKEHIQPVINGVIGLIGDLADGLKVLWEKMLKPLIDWIIKNILPPIMKVVDNVVSVVMNLAGHIADIVSGIINGFRGLIQIVTGIFSGDWKKAFDGAKKIFDSFKNNIKSIANILIDVVEGMVNGVIMGLNLAIGALNKLNIDVPDWVTSLTGMESLGFNIPKIPKAKLPRLADGAVIRGGDPFMAVLGDQRRGQTNIETPLPTMVKAFKQAIAESGSMGGGEYTFVAQLDGKTIFKETVKQDRMYRKSTGQSGFAY